MVEKKWKTHKPAGIVPQDLVIYIKDKENKPARGENHFWALWIIFERLKSCFLVDLRSFLLLSFVNWEQRSLYCNKEAAATYTCCAVSDQLSQLWFVSYPTHSCAQPPNVAPISRNKFKSVPQLRGRTLHLIALFWIPTARKQLRKTTRNSITKLLRRLTTTSKAFSVQQWWFVFFFSHRVQKLPLFANFWEAVALSGALQHL